MCGIVGYVGRGHEAQQVIVDGAAAARVPRLRLGGRRDLRGRLASRSGAPSASSRNLEAALRDRPLSGPHRHRPHALGHPRQAVRAQRAPAQGRLGRGRAQRHHGELPRAARRARGGRPHDRLRHRHRADRAPDRRAPDARAATSSRAVREACARVVGSYAFGVLSETDPEHIVVGQERRQPDRARPRREAELPRQRHPGDPALHAPDAVPRGRRVRRALRGRRAGARPQRHARSTASRARSSGTRSRRRRAATTASCRRRSTSSRAPSPTRSGRACSRPRATSTSTASTSRGRACAGIRRIALVACGTAWHSCLVGKYMIEQLAGIPCDVDLASEFRYREPDPRRGRAGDPGLAVGRDRRHPRRAARGQGPGLAGARDLQRAGRHDRAREPTTCSTPTPAPRSAWRAPRRSPPRWSRSTCSR